MITKIFELFARQDEMASFAGTSLSILSDLQGDRILSKENFAVVKVSSFVSSFRMHVPIDEPSFAGFVQTTPVQ